jgi:ABC-type nickel/cobalt efflux system permease component RcnA
MKMSNTHSTAKQRCGFISHEGLTVALVCALIAPLIVLLARKTGVTWLAVIGGLIFSLGVFALISHLVAIAHYHQERRRNKELGESRAVVDDCDPPCTLPASENLATEIERSDRDA